jgi:amidase/aspartyl-tRNA(Asn)/glutamyl-tRNA(Gln) amidotransferase subunit A
VACGAAWAALGSDTGGSIRIPAALQGLVGFKSTQRLTPLAGSIPLSTTLDTACAITLSVRDAALLHELLSTCPIRPSGRPLNRMRFAVPTTLLLDTLEPAVAHAFERTLAALRDDGAIVQEIELPELAELASINAQGGFSAAESWAWHRAMLASAGDRYDPRVATRIRRGQQISAADYIDLVHTRRDWIQRVEAKLHGFDAALSPTVPIVAPPIAPLLNDDQAFFDVNGKLLRNTSPVNFLDGCALSLPCHEPGELPVGLMVWAPAMRDDDVLEASHLIEHRLARMGS